MKHEDFLPLNNQSEAAFLESVLREEGIPHFIRTFADAAYDGLHQIQLGWGRVETPKEYRARIRQLLTELREGNPKQ